MSGFDGAAMCLAIPAIGAWPAEKVRKIKLVPVFKILYRAEGRRNLFLKIRPDPCVYGNPVRTLTLDDCDDSFP